MVRRALALGVVVTTMLALLLGAAPTARADAPTDEAAFVQRINDLRATKGLPALQVHPELTSVARRWAAHMAAEGTISHNPNLAAEVTSNWKKLGENVGMGGDVNSLHQAFVNSPAHYRNLVETDFAYVGIGVVYGADGTIFVAEEFMQLFPAPAPAPAPTPTTTAPRPAPAPAAVPVTTTTAVPAAAPAPAPAPVETRLAVVLQQLQALESLS